MRFYDFNIGSEDKQNERSANGSVSSFCKHFFKFYRSKLI